MGDDSDLTRRQLAAEFHENEMWTAVVEARSAYNDARLSAVNLSELSVAYTTFGRVLVEYADYLNEFLRVFSEGSDDPDA